jgi:hypothetical protein
MGDKETKKRKNNCLLSKATNNGQENTLMYLNSNHCVFFIFPLKKIM